MRGLALEGGGARGAYHIGVVKAFTEKGYEFDGFVGTSIGSINAAALAQGDFEQTLELWMNISMDQVFEQEEQQLLLLAEKKGLKLDAGLPINVKKALAKIINGKGISTDKMKTLLAQYIHEDKVRGSGKDYGLVTFSITDRKPRELMLEDIPQGQLVNYIMASASLPGFRPETIDGEAFLDGGIYNNCPVNLLLDKNYDEIIALRTGAFGIVQKIKDTSKIKYISPSENLGSILLFTPEHSEAQIKIGYYDGLRFIEHLRGQSYYIKPVDSNLFNVQLMSLNDEIILEAGKILEFPEMNTKRMLFEKIIPQLSAYLKLGRDCDYADFCIALLEYAAKQKKIERYRIYEYDQLNTLVKESPIEEKKGALSLLPSNIILSRKKVAVETLITNLL